MESYSNLIIYKYRYNIGYALYAMPLLLMLSAIVTDVITVLSAIFSAITVVLSAITATLLHSTTLASYVTFMTLFISTIYSHLFYTSVKFLTLDMTQ